MPENFMSSWIVWAMLSAAFAALTAIFAKVGVETVNSDLATFIRTVVILAVLGAILAARGLALIFRPLAHRWDNECVHASWRLHFSSLLPHQVQLLQFRCGRVFACRV